MSTNHGKCVLAGTGKYKEDHPYMIHATIPKTGVRVHIQVIGDEVCDVYDFLRRGEAFDLKVEELI